MPGNAGAATEQALWMLNAQMEADARLARTYPDIVQVALQAVRRIVADFDDVTLTNAAVQAALDAFRDSSVVTIWVHPVHWDAIHDMKAAFAKRCPALRSIRIERDPSLTQTGCRLSSELGVVNFDARDQMRSIEQAMQTLFEEVVPPADREVMETLQR